jgi:hypothetical protein
MHQQAPEQVEGNLFGGLEVELGGQRRGLGRDLPPVRLIGMNDVSSPPQMGMHRTVGRRASVTQVMHPESPFTLSASLQLLPLAPGPYLQDKARQRNEAHPP